MKDLFHMELSKREHLTLRTNSQQPGSLKMKTPLFDAPHDGVGSRVTGVTGGLHDVPMFLAY